MNCCLWNGLASCGDQCLHRYLLIYQLQWSLQIDCPLQDTKSETLQYANLTKYIRIIMEIYTWRIKSFLQDIEHRIDYTLKLFWGFYKMRTLYVIFALHFNCFLAAKPRSTLLWAKFPSLLWIQQLKHPTTIMKQNCSKAFLCPCQYSHYNSCPCRRG